MLGKGALIKLLILLLFISSFHLYAQDNESDEFDDLDEMGLLEDDLDSIAPIEEEISDKEETDDIASDGGLEDEISEDELNFDVDENEVVERKLPPVNEPGSDDILTELNLNEEEFDKEKEEQSQEDIFAELYSEETDSEISNSADFEQKDRDNINVFTIEKRQSINEIVKSAKRDSTRNLTPDQVKALKLQLEDIAKSPTRLIQVFKGTRLIRIKDNQIVYTPRTFTARAHTLTDYYKNRYIVNKEGELVYKIFYENTSDIKQITTLYRTPHYFKPLKQKKNLNIIDIKEPVYHFNFKFHTGLNYPEYTQSLLPDPSSFAPVLRLEGNYWLANNFKFDPGFTFSFESISGNMAGDNKYSIVSYSVGPQIRTKPIWDSDFALYTQVRISLYSNLSYTTTSETQDIELAETALVIGAENNKAKTNFNYGFNIQRKWIKANTTDLVAQVSNRVDYDDSFAVFLGYIWK